MHSYGCTLGVLRGSYGCALEVLMGVCIAMGVRWEC